MPMPRASAVRPRPRALNRPVRGVAGLAHVERPLVRFAMPPAFAIWRESDFGRAISLAGLSRLARPPGRKWKSSFVVSLIRP